MSPKKLAAITGMKVDVARHGSLFNVVCQSVGVRFEATSSSLKNAVKRILADHWRWVQSVVAERQGYKCNRCGMIRPLQFHHIVARSKGRRDSPDNIEGLCHECHRREHSTPKSQNRVHRTSPKQEEPLHATEGQAGGF